MAKRQAKTSPSDRSTPEPSKKAKNPVPSTLQETSPELAPPPNIEIVSATAVSDPATGGVQRAARIPILGEAHGEVTVFQPVIIKEISRTGANVQTAFPLHLNSLHDFRLSLGERSIQSNHSTSSRQVHPRFNPDSSGIGKRGAKIKWRGEEDRRRWEIE